ncbi:hypothetical protein A8C56_06250 [Niabella ginsenosidivorans]|uniref:Glycosyl transferase family 1 domain-containing protein n=2 Tax=Niabella ginsenosidivorans TaxID=1176587 RepID=A0A1A9HZ27_9BACT|nr:hypothetical protein A8C56_06250 [Niabella ginsenosidivorans]
MVGKWIKESAVINATFDCRYINLLASKTVEESGRLSIGKVLGFVDTWCRLLKALLFSRPDICYFALTTTGAAFYKDVALVVVLKLFGVKTVYHLHNKGVQKASGNWLNRALYQYAFKNGLVVLLSEHLYGDVAAYVPQKSVRICANGVPGVKILPGLEREHNEPVQILFLSNLIESKGVFVLLEAMALLKKRGLVFKGVFAGGEADIDATRFKKEAIRQGLYDRVVYLGRKYGTEKEELFQQADIFVFPTYYENECFPLVLLEAMQHALPVVSTFEGGIPDIVEDGTTGYLVAQKNVSALACRIQELIETPRLCRQMGMAGRKKYETHFTLNLFEKRIVDILTETGLS